MVKLGSLLGNALQSLFSKPATQQYPTVKTATPIRLRGALIYDADKCTGCNMCVRDCPADAIEILIVDRKAKKFVMRYHYDRCVFCAQCVASCKFDCLEMSNEEWELAEVEKEPFTVYYGNEENVKFILDQAASTESEDNKEG
ncbi:MAG: 4Fe-4S binding protein [Anaerolineaceae bacterium]|nr:4Fe-4S binding protein [Anaerolineaceae bacterium]